MTPITPSIRDVRNFDRVSLDGSGELFLTQGEKESLAIEAAPDTLSRIVTEVRGGTLHIGLKSRSLFHLGRVTYRLMMKNIAGIESHSSGNIVAKDLRTDSLRIVVSSSGNITVESLVASSLDTAISSSGSFTLAGSVDRQDVRISSSGECRAGRLSSRTARVLVSSSGNATLWVKESLEVRISSSGEVRYYGRPRITSQITSSGRLISLGEK